MTHTNPWSNTTPVNNQFAGKGANEIIETKTDIYERLTLDHYMDGELDDTKATGEGRHRKVTLAALSEDPAVLTDAVVMYYKSDGIYLRNSTGIRKLF